MMNKKLPALCVFSVYYVVKNINHRENRGAAEQSEKKTL